NHDVDGVLQFQDLAADVDRDLFRQVAIGDGGGDVGDIAHLGGQVGRHQVDVVGQVLPHASCAFDLGLAAEFALGPHLLGDAGDLGGEGSKLMDHRVDGARRSQKLALERPAVQLQVHGLEQIALGDRADDAGDAGQVLGIPLIELG